MMITKNYIQPKLIFSKLIQIFFPNFEKRNFDSGELKEEITISKKLEVKKPEIKIIGPKDELINSNIEILNEEFLNIIQNSRENTEKQRCIP